MCVRHMTLTAGNARLPRGFDPGIGAGPGGGEQEGTSPGGEVAAVEESPDDVADALEGGLPA